MEAVHFSGTSDKYLAIDTASYTAPQKLDPLTNTYQAEDFTATYVSGAAASHFRGQYSSSHAVTKTSAFCRYSCDVSAQSF
jgi:hypothetical protein